MIQSIPYHESACCGTRMYNYPEIDLCPSCKEHTEPYEFIDDDNADEEHDRDREEMDIIRLKYEL